MKKTRPITSIRGNILPLAFLAIFAVALILVYKNKFVTPKPNQSLSQVQAEGDTSPPSAPTYLKVYGNLATTRSGGSHDDLSWSPSTDDSGAVTYRVYQIVSGIVYDANPLAEVSTTSWSRSFPVDGYATDYSYYVVAKDGSGNLSPKSNIAHMTGIWGDVLDSSNSRYVRGAKINVSGINGFKTTAYANYGGAYLVNLVPGDYTITISASGYIPQSSAVSVLDNKMSGNTVFLLKSKR